MSLKKIILDRVGTPALKLCAYLAASKLDALREDAGHVVFSQILQLNRNKASMMMPLNKAIKSLRRQAQPFGSLQAGRHILQRYAALLTE